ncbi:MAG TPA: cohesin domain-containing protein [Candidatus Doudnabacteria bacterium]|nr:cohesin domain-containing protein [Candidatus Doudnabacteria bacterium]
MRISYNLIKFLGFIAALGVIFAGLIWFAQTAQAANFSLSPASGEHAVGSTFDVAVQIDTRGQNINAVQMELSFPPDKLQLISPSAGSSIIQIYTSPPKFDNSLGRVEIIGGIPNGINVSNGLISTLTFRVRSVGSASLRFTGQSQILLNDGRGTNVLQNTFGATYNLILPPQQGPIIVSDSHPDQEVWYRERRGRVEWGKRLPPAEG